MFFVRHVLFSQVSLFICSPDFLFSTFHAGFPLKMDSQKMGWLALWVLTLVACFCFLGVFFLLGFAFSIFQLGSYVEFANARARVFFPPQKQALFYEPFPSLVFNMPTWVFDIWLSREPIEKTKNSRVPDTSQLGQSIEDSFFGCRRPPSTTWVP